MCALSECERDKPGAVKSMHRSTLAIGLLVELVVRVDVEREVPRAVEVPAVRRFETAERSEPELDARFGIHGHLAQLAFRSLRTSYSVHRARNGHRRAARLLVLDESEIVAVDILLERLASVCGPNGVDAVLRGAAALRARLFLHERRKLRLVGQDLVDHLAIARCEELIACFG